MDKRDKVANMEKWLCVVRTILSGWSVQFGNGSEGDEIRLSVVLIKQITLSAELP